MKLGRFNKDPIERKRYTVDYSNWADEGETLLDVSFTVEPDVVGGVSVDAFSILAGAASVGLFVSGGLDRETYKVKILVTTSIGQVREDEITFAVRDL